MLVSFLPLLSVTLMLQLFLVWGSPPSSYLSVAEQVIQDLMFLPIWLLLQPKCFSPALSPKKEKKAEGFGVCMKNVIGKPCNVSNFEYKKLVTSNNFSLDSLSRKFSHQDKIQTKSILTYIHSSTHPGNK